MKEGETGRRGMRDEGRRGKQVKKGEIERHKERDYMKGGF